MRWAGLIRVSTEKQKEKGESLRTQKAFIEDAVRTMGDNPKAIRWYGGQEHATPDWEKKEIARLLMDSGKDLYDAVNVYNASRWSRDNLDSKKGLKILKEDGKRFFTLTQEWDLYKPSDTLFLGVNAEIGEYQAREQARISMQNRIGRAKRGMPSCGKLPYGRIFNGRTWDGRQLEKHKEGWELDATARKKIERAAKRYLDGESMETIAATCEMNASNLWKILTKRSGDNWNQEFDAKGLKIHEIVPTPVPRLLEDSVIAEIHKKADLNRKFTRGVGRHKYLLSHYVYCADCGYALSGNVNHQGRSYYRHNSQKRIGRPCVHCGRSVPADLLENSVLIQLIQTLGDEINLQKAIERATPNKEKTEALNEEKAEIEKDLKTVSKKMDRVKDFGEDGTYTKEDVKSRLEKLRAEEGSKKSRLSVIEQELESQPDPAKVKRLSQFAMQVFGDSSQNPKVYFTKDYKWKARYDNKWKRSLIELAFTGFDREGKPLGVYVHNVSKKNRWTLDIRGILENVLTGVKSLIPLDDDFLMEAFGLDTTYQSDDTVDTELKKIKSSLTNFPLS